MTESPILSIVIPTRNRHEYLAILIRSLLAMGSRDFEVIVHDNSESNDHYGELFRSIGDSRLRYFFDSTRMSITQNFERGIGLASGNYICMIGDDDGVSESIVDLTRWMSSTGIDAAVSAVPTYLWPGVSSALDGAQTHGVLRLPRCSGKLRIVSSQAALDAVLDSGATRIGHLPSVYQGVISRRALEKLKALAGTYFPGPSPDMANAIGLSAVVDRFASVSAPIVISGSCPGSGAAQGAERAHQGEISERTFLPADTAARWPPEVPFYFSGPTLWATTLTHALTATGRMELLSGLRYDRLYAACAVFHPQYRERMEVARSRNAESVSSASLRVAVCWIWWQRAKALSGNLLRRLGGKILGSRVAAVADIGEAITYVNRRISAQPVDFTKRY